MPDKPAKIKRKKVRPNIYRVWRHTPKPGEYYVYDLELSGTKIRTPRGEYFKKLDECEDAVSQIRMAHRRGKYRFDESQITVAQLADEWIARLERNLRSKSHVQAARRVLELFAKSLIGVRVTELKRADLERFVTDRLRAGVRPQTVNTEVTILMTALNKADSVFEELEDWKPPRKPAVIDPQHSGRERIITREEESAILRGFHAAHEARRLHSSEGRIQAAKIFWLALRTGMRAGELLALTRISVSFERGIKMAHGWIQVRTTHAIGTREKTKGGNKRVIPMTEPVAALLKEQLESHTHGYVFPSRAGRRWAASWLGDLLEQACLEARVVYGRNNPGGIVFHDTRHTAATRMLHAGMDLKTVGSILGHSDVWMTMRYGHATPASREAAVQALGSEPFPGSPGVVTSGQEAPNPARTDHGDDRAARG